MKRVLLNGLEVEEFENAIDITIHTRCPGKWKLVDMETGQEYVATHESPHADILGALAVKYIVPKPYIKYGTWIKTKNRVNVDESKQEP